MERGREPRFQSSAFRAVSWILSRLGCGVVLTLLVGGLEHTYSGFYVLIYGLVPTLLVADALLYFTGC